MAIWGVQMLRGVMRRACCAMLMAAHGSEQGTDKTWDVAAENLQTWACAVSAQTLPFHA